MKRYTEQELKQYAEEAAQTIVIRTYENGNSKDERRPSSKPEQAIIATIIYGGLLAINNGSNADSAISACAFIGDLQIPEMNGYDTIYQPLRNFQF